MCSGFLFALAAEVILWNGPLWYANEEHKVPAVLTQSAGVAVVVDGALLALVAALCLARALVPLTSSSAVSGAVPAEVRGGPVLPLCGLIFLPAAVGPFQESRRASADHAFAQT
jgi:hypothetical protein